MTRTVVSKHRDRCNRGAATLRRRSRRRDRSTTFVAVLESLEDMTLLSTIYWNSPSGGDWAVASNWDGGQLPGPGDDVVIDDLSSAPLITYSSGTTTVASLTCNETFELSGGSLTITGSLAIAADRSLLVNGPGSSFTAAGSVSFDQVNVRVSGGGSIALPGATSYMNVGGLATFVVSGSESTLDLSGLTSLDGGHGSACSQCTPFNLTVQADSGGTVDLSNLPVAAGLIHFIAEDAGSTVELASLGSVERRLIRSPRPRIDPCPDVDVARRFKPLGLRWWVARLSRRDDLPCTLERRDLGRLGPRQHDRPVRSDLDGRRARNSLLPVWCIRDNYPSLVGRHDRPFESYNRHRPRQFHRPGRRLDD